MQENNWTPEHSEALRQHLARGMSFSQISRAINSTFQTSYSRSAAIGRAKRMGLCKAAPEDRPARWPRRPRRSKAARLQKPRERHAPESIKPVPEWKRGKPPKLRCIEIVPRHLCLVDLEIGDCRYPYGGDADGEPITFCAHPRREGSSYCTPRLGTTDRQGFAARRGGGMKSASEPNASRVAGRIKLLPRRHRIAHLRALLRLAAASLRRHHLAAMLCEELSRQAAHESPAT